VQLTRDGQALYRKLHQPLAVLASQFAEISQSTQQERLLISVDFAFAYFWLLPGLPKIREKLGKVDVCVLTSQQPSVDAVADTDLIIQMGNSSQTGTAASVLIKEEVGILCSPQFKRAHPELQTPADLKSANQLLLHLNSPSKNIYWCNWAEWLNHWNVDTAGLGKGTVFNNYEMIVQAAVGGQGIALGWGGLVDDLVRNQALTKLMPETVKTVRGYYIAYTKNNPSSTATELHNWIVQETSP